MEQDGRIRLPQDQIIPAEQAKVLRLAGKDCNDEELDEAADVLRTPNLTRY
jgi:hypothetical protein